MKKYQLRNEVLTIQINDFGAELSSIKDNNTQTEYLWNGDPSFWKRQSPVLFPFVGKVKNNTYKYNGTSYSMLQHGFARDMNFSLKEKTENKLLFQLESSEETEKIYPFQFILEIGYQLTGNKIIVSWKVVNTGKSNMYFSIGAHPAFICPLNSNFKQTDYFIGFDNSIIHYLLLNEDGLVLKNPIDKQNILPTENNLFSITKDIFDNDALIIENNQCNKVALLTPDKKPYVTVYFDAPLVGLWSPAKKNAPFVCIEPWYGRSDSNDFNGSLEEREWGNQLKTGDKFEASYSIEIE